MALYNRKMVFIVKDKVKDEDSLVYDEKNTICLNCSPERCPSECGTIVPGDEYFLPPPPVITSDHKHHMPSYFIPMICLFGAFFVFVCYMVTVRRYRSNSSDSGRRNLENLDENVEDFIDENNHGPVLDHPIWYIRTVGLQQSIIDSIAVFRYKKSEALIEGTDCSVCLTEFEEDECLRLLPKCSHAFHIPCIDTWLRSHKNCPLCRAPIVCDVNVVQINNVEIPNTDEADSSPSVIDSVENNRGNIDHLENQELGEEENHETRLPAEDLDDALEKIPGVVREMKKGLRVLSDLAEHRVKIDEELQPARRSVSMDSSGALMIHLAMSEMNPGNGEGCSNPDNRLVEEKTENCNIVAKRGNRNSSLYKAMKSSSFGRSLKVPICMKRSFSTSGKTTSTSERQELRQSL